MFVDVVQRCALLNCSVLCRFCRSLSASCVPSAPVTRCSSDCLFVFSNLSVVSSFPGRYCLVKTHLELVASSPVSHFQDSRREKRKQLLTFCDVFRYPESLKSFRRELSTFWVRFPTSPDRSREGSSRVASDFRQFFLSPKAMDIVCHQSENSAQGGHLRKSPLTTLRPHRPPPFEFARFSPSALITELFVDFSDLAEEGMRTAFSVRAAASGCSVFDLPPFLPPFRASTYQYAHPVAIHKP